MNIELFHLLLIMSKNFLVSLSNVMINMILMSSHLGVSNKISFKEHKSLSHHNLNYFDFKFIIIDQKQFWIKIKGCLQYNRYMFEYLLISKCIY